MNAGTATAQAARCARISSGASGLAELLEAPGSMARPVPALETARRLLEPGAAVLIADSRTAGAARRVPPGRQGGRRQDVRELQRRSIS
jgi:hypothetical protein